MNLYIGRCDVKEDCENIVVCSIVNLVISNELFAIVTQKDFKNPETTVITAIIIISSISLYY